MGKFALICSCLILFLVAFIWSNRQTIVEPPNNLISQSPLLQPTPIPTLPPIPVSKILSGGQHTFQTFNNCGPAALSMTLSFYGETISQQTLGNQLRPYQRSNGDNDDKSVTLAELAQVARERGYSTYHRPAGDTELIQQFIAHDMPVITRTWLKVGEDIGHFRVIKGYDNSRNVLIQDDSLQGKNLEYSYDSFNQLWQAFNYEFLVLVPTDQQDIAAQILGERVNEDRAWQLALELAKAQLSEEPTNIYAHFNQSVALYHLGEYQRAVDGYESISSQLPNRMLWYQTEPIIAYYRLGQHSDVLQMTQEIFDSQNRAYSELHWIRGEIFQQRSQTQLAEEEFALAERYNPTPYWKVNLE